MASTDTVRTRTPGQQRLVSAPTELVVYYVKGKAGKTASFTPGASDGLVSNVVNIPFTISNRTSNAFPPTDLYCMNGQVFAPNNTNTPAGQPAVSAQVFNPSEGQTVGVSGSGWILDLLFDATSSKSNALISADAGHSSGSLINHRRYSNPARIFSCRGSSYF